MTAVIGAVIVLGSTAAAQGAIAGPAPSAIVSVPCNTPALISAISDASSGRSTRSRAAPADRRRYGRDQVVPGGMAGTRASRAMTSWLTASGRRPSVATVSVATVS